MKDIRQGNDIRISWSIFKKNGQIFSLEGKNISLYLKSVFGRKELNDFVITGNIIQWTFYGKDQKSTGKYSLELVVNEGEKGMITTDTCDFVNLVSCSCKIQGGEDAPNVETESIELTSTLEYVSGGGDYDDTALWRALDGKVDKVEGLGLSEENYTTEEKEKLAGLENYDDSGIKGELAKKVESEVVVDTESTEDFEFGYDDTEIRQEIAELSAEVGKKQDTITDLDTIRSGAAKGATALQSVPEEYATKEYVNEAIKNIPQGGGGSGMTTPSGDPMHYMYEAVGAEWNGTGADIERQGVYGDTITHKAGYWYLNELGDITTEEMRQIYLYANLDNGAKGVTKYLTGIETRTNIATWSSSWNGKIKDQEAFSYAYKVIVARMRNKEHYIDTNASFAFASCQELQKILPTLDATYTTSFNGTFDSCNNLREVRIKNIKVAIKFDKSPMISKASILYLIQNSAATSAMVITLHADAYARLAEDADIVAALAEKTNVSLAK